MITVFGVPTGINHVSPVNYDNLSFAFYIKASGSTLFSIGGIDDSYGNSPECLFSTFNVFTVYKYGTIDVRDAENGACMNSYGISLSGYRRLRLRCVLCEVFWRCLLRQRCGLFLRRISPVTRVYEYGMHPCNKIDSSGNMTYSYEDDYIFGKGECYNSYGQADYWWLRSPRSGGTGYTFHVRSNGGVDVNFDHGVVYSYGLGVTRLYGY